VQLTWLLGYIRQHCDAEPRATTQPCCFNDGVELLIAEAMVTSDGKPEPVDGLQDHADAAAAAIRLAELLLTATLEHLTADVSCQPHTALNLAAVAAMHAGLAIDPAELQLDVLVAKVRPRSVS
jgi:hypothetical protein